MDGTKQQIARLINKSNKILIATPENACGDALGSALALANTIKKLNKNIQAIIPESLPEKFKFLNEYSKTNPLSYHQLKEREFVLTVKNPQNHINNLYYQKDEGLLHIYLGGKNEIKENDFEIKRNHPFDLVFIIKSRDYERLGKIFEYNPELFIETPVVNIDNHPDNENFGEINLTDITSSSVSEIVMNLIHFIDRNLLDKAIATQILAGLIDATNNFQYPGTNPRTFNNAAILINRGGDQQKIIRYFYKTKSINFLRLWGRILHQLSQDRKNKLVWGKIQEKDFQQTNTRPDHAIQSLEEIKAHFPNMKTSFLIWNHNNAIEGTIYSSSFKIIKKISLEFGEKINANNAVNFKVNSNNLEKTEKQLRDLIIAEK